MARSGRILVTGAAGFIGSTLVDRLLSEGREVVGLDSFDPFYAEAMKRGNLTGALANPNFSLAEADIRDAEAMNQLFSEGSFEVVLHLAARAGVRPSLANPVEYSDVNVNGTTVLLEAAVRHGNPQFVFASSSSVYGERKEGPFAETDVVDRPISPYAATKKAGELIAHSFHHAHGLPVTCVRFFTCYGPRQRPDLAIRLFAEKMQRGEAVTIFGDGSCTRDFTYIDDIVDGLVRAVDVDLGYSILNFGAGRTVSILEFVEVLEKELGVEAVKDFQPRQVGDVSTTFADIRAAEKALGYRPEVVLEEGIARFVKWLKGDR
jgi:UDP-glucuronate 4-epimerase